MTIDINDLIQSITESLNRIDYIKADEIPNIDLYMDQVTSFLDEHLRSSTRNKEEDKILTKTMINNYAKNNLLPPPVKKKYSKDHMINLLLIYYLKSFLSINDIETVFKPLNEEFFGKKDGLNLIDIYEQIRIKADEQLPNVIKDINDKYEMSKDIYKTGDSKEERQLQLFAFIMMLSVDVYIKKLLVEKLIDGYNVVDNTYEAAKDGKRDKK